MALIPSARYPGQVSTSNLDSYPYGQAQNQSTYGDGTGTPLEKDLVNDIWGFLQGLLVAGGITPSGDPDKADDSQYLAAIQALIAPVTALGADLNARTNIIETAARFAIGDGETSGRVDLTESFDHSPGGNFALSASMLVTVPAAGWYLVSVSVQLQNTDGGAAQAVGISLALDSTVKVSNSTTVPADGLAFVSFTELIQITAPGSQRINLVLGSDTGLLAAYGTGVSGSMVIRGQVP
jgi:hypothetical protein